MPRKGRRSSAAQIRQLENIQKKRWASPGEAEGVDGKGRGTAIEESKHRIKKAEREAERCRNDRRNAERRVRKNLLSALSLLSFPADDRH